MNKPRRKKNETEETYIKRACEEYHLHGYHIDEIAKRLNISMIEVYNHVSKGNKITTEDERNEMIHMRSIGCSYAEISRVTGRSRSCIKARIAAPAKIGCHSKRMLTDKQLKQMKEMAHDGVYIGTIAEILGESRGSISHRLNQCGIKRCTKVSKDEEKKYVKMFKSGKNAVQIAKACDRAASTVRFHLHKLGY